MTLAGEEFIRRFLLHALPGGFHRTLTQRGGSGRYRPQQPAPDFRATIPFSRKAARRGGVMRFVEDQERAGPEIAQRIDEAGGVGRIDQQPVRYEKPTGRRPRVDAEAAFAADVLQELAVEGDGAQPEAGLELLGPLPEHRGRDGSDDEIDAAAEQQLAQDQTGLDGFAEADIVGDHQIDARQQPIRHALGALLLEQDRAAEAEAVYREDLGLGGALPRAQTHPDNLWALRGLLDCLQRRGETAEAALIRQRLDFAAARADLPVSVSCFCARGKAA